MTLDPLEVQGLRELLQRIPWMSTAEALFLKDVMLKLEPPRPRKRKKKVSEPATVLIPFDAPDPEGPAEPLRPDPLAGY